jgi:hypothetical protein
LPRAFSARIREGLTLTAWGEQLKRDALELLAEVRRIRGGGDDKRKR